MTTLDLQNPAASLFPSFPRLPPEIRQEIWIRSFPHFHSPIKFTITKSAKHISPASRPIPPLLHVNRESRSLSLSHYIKGFHVRILCPHGAENDKKSSEMFWDPDDKEMLIQGPNHCYVPPSPHHHVKMGFDERVKEIGLSDALWCLRFVPDGSMWSALEHGMWLCGFPGLERVTVYVNRFKGERGKSEWSGRGGRNRDEVEWGRVRGERERRYNDLVKAMVDIRRTGRKVSEQQREVMERVRLEIVDMTEEVGGILNPAE